MSAETIVNKIRSDAEKKSKEIKEKAEKEAQLITAEAKKSAKAEANEILEKGKQQAENKKKILISQAHQLAKRNEMNVKEDIIETCFNKALENLGQLDENAYKNLIEQLIRHAQEQINGNVQIKVSNDLDKQVAEKMGLAVIGETGATGGILLLSENGTISIDNTFEGIMKREKHRIRVHVGQLLFSEQTSEP